MPYVPAPTWWQSRKRYTSHDGNATNPCKPSRWRVRLAGGKTDRISLGIAFASYRKKKHLWCLYMDAKRGRTRARSKREAAFCKIFADMLLALPAVCGPDDMKKAAPRKMRTELGAQALAAAGYTMGKGRNQASKLEVKADQLLALPRVQGEIMDCLAAAGLTITRVGQVMTEIFDAQLGERIETDIVIEGEEGEKKPKQVTVKTGVSAAEKLHAAELFFKVTTGFAPTKNATLNMGAKSTDNFFTPEKFKDPGMPALTFDQED